MLLIEGGVLAFFRHDFNIKVVAVSLFDHAHQVACDAMTLIFRIDQHVMHVSHHLSVIEHAHQAHQAVAVPCAEHGGRSHQSLVQTFRIFTRHPSDGPEQLLRLFFGELLFIGIRDFHSPERSYMLRADLSQSLHWDMILESRLRWLRPASNRTQRP